MENLKSNDINCVCTNCGEKLEEGTLFCPKCGTRFNSAQGGYPNMTSENQNITASNPDSNFIMSQNAINEYNAKIYANTKMQDSVKHIVMNNIPVIVSLAIGLIMFLFGLVDESYLFIVGGLVVVSSAISKIKIVKTDDTDNLK